METKSMRRVIVLVSAWAAVTLLTAAVAWGVVRLAGSGVTDAALQPLSSAQVNEMGTTAPAAEDAPASSIPDGSGVTSPAASSTTLPEASTSTVSPATTRPAPSTTTPAAPASTTTTPTTPSPTTTTTAPTAPSAGTTTTVPSATTTSAGPATTITGGTRAFTYPEGTVVVRFDGSAVKLVSASPAPGFRVEVKAAGPPEVDVEFEGGDEDARFRARVEDGQLVGSLDRDD